MLLRVPAVVVLCVLGACGSERPALASLACVVDNIEGATGNPPAAAAGSRVTVAGWAGDPRSKQASTDVIVRLVAPNGAIAASGKREQPIARPDVATHYKIPEMGMSGFRAAIDTKGLGPGTYEISIESRFDAFSVVCSGGSRTVTLK